MSRDDSDPDIHDHDQQLQHSQELFLTNIEDFNEGNNLVEGHALLPQLDPEKDEEEEDEVQNQLSFSFLLNQAQDSSIAFSDESDISEIGNKLAEEKLKHRLNLQKLLNLFESQDRIEEPQINEILSIIQVYAHNEKMNSLLVESHILEKYLVTSSNKIIIKMILELLSLCFASGRVEIRTGKTMIYKIHSLISDESLREKLIADQMRMLTDLVKIIKVLLSNREFNDQISHLIKTLDIEGKLRKFSDCTNQEFQKEIIDLSKQLGSHHQGTEMNILLKMQEDFIKKSGTKFSKPIFEIYEQFKSLDDLLGKGEHKPSEPLISRKLKKIVGIYIQVKYDQDSKLLNSLEKEKTKQLRKILDIICCKILMKLAKFQNETSSGMVSFMELASSQNQFMKVKTTLRPDLKNDKSRWNQQKLVDQIQEYLQHPESVPIQNIINNLVSIPSMEYSNLLIQLFLRSKAEEMMLPPKLTLREVQQKIIQRIPLKFCKLDSNFYEVLNSGIEGANLGLKYPNVGQRGLQIYSKKFMNSLQLQQISTYAQLLSYKKTSSELEYLKNCRIYEVVNDKLPYFIKNNQSLTQLCNLISQTCKDPSFCNCYQVTSNLCNYFVDSGLEPKDRAHILNTIKNLAKNSEKNKRKIQNVEFLSELIKMLPKFEKQELSNVAELLLMGSDDNKEVKQLYQQLSLEVFIIDNLKSLLKRDMQNYETSLNFLRVLEGMSSGKSAVLILKHGFMRLCQPISVQSIKASNFELIGSTIDILRNLLEEMEFSLCRVVSELQEHEFFKYLLFVGDYIAKSRQTESYLDIYCMLLSNPTISKKFIDNLDKVLSILNELAIDQLSTQALLQQWMRVLFLLFESNRYSFVSQILKSNIFFSSANCLRSFQTLNENLLSLNSRMMRGIVTKSEVKPMLALHGYADFLVQLMRMQNLPIDEYLRILNTVSELYQNQHFKGKLCTELFVVVITKLQLSWKEDISNSSIILLKTIKRKVEVTAEFGTNMLDFFGRFLTQSQTVSSSEYYAISRKLICLLSNFLIFNKTIQIYFRTDLVIDILKNWVRIAKTQCVDEMAQTFKLFYYATYASHSLYIDLCEVNSKSIANAQLVFERGWRCNLFRVNGSKKEAFLKFDKSKQEIIACEFPDGVVKDKYRIHLKDLLIIQNYQSQEDILFLESSLNNLQPKPLPTNCLTFIGLSENNQEVREISIEVLKKQDLSQIQSNATILASKWNEGQIEEQSKTWQMLNKK